MARPDLTGTLEIPAGLAPRDTEIRLRLVVNVDGDAVGFTVDGTELVGVQTARPDANGDYTFTDLRPNSGSSGDQIDTPANTVYERTISFRGRPAVVDYLDIPDVAGPVAAKDCVTALPSALTLFQADRIQLNPTVDSYGDLQAWAEGIENDAVQIADLADGTAARTDKVLFVDPGTGTVELDTIADVLDLATIADVDGLQAALDGKASSSHTHTQGDVTNLTTDLAAKAALSGAAFTGAVSTTGELSSTAGPGKVRVWENASNESVLSLYAVDSDAQPIIAFAKVLGLPTILFGPGGASSGDAGIARSAAGTLSLLGLTKITDSTDATAATDLVNLQTMQAHVGQHKAGRKTSGQNLTQSNTTPENVTSMSFTVAANEVWAVEFVQFVTNPSVNSDSRWSITGPSGASGQVAVIGLNTNVTSEAGNAKHGTSTVGGSAITVGGYAGQLCVVIKAIVVNGANAGTVQLLAAQGTSTAETVTVDTGSHYVATRIA